MATQMKQRRDTAANWASVNPVLADGEIGYEKVTGKFKIGDGVTAWNSASYNAILPAAIGANSGICPLDGSGKVDASYLPSYVDDALEYANLAALPVTGETGKMYVTLDDGLIYRWSGTIYINIASQPTTIDGGGA